MTTVSIEQIAQYDADTIGQINRLMPELDEGFRPNDITEAYFDQYFKGSTERLMLAARIGSTVVGSLTVNTVVEQSPAALHTEIGGVVVSPEARGKKIAHKMLRHAVHCTRTRGINRITLNTETSRTAAEKLYRDFGFMQTPGTVGHYEYQIPDIDIPDGVFNVFGITDRAAITPITTGIINGTHLVEDGLHTTILQRLNSSLDRRLLEDSSVIAEHLVSEGWESPVTLPTIDGRHYFEDSAGNIWRNLQFIESDTLTPAMLETEKIMYLTGHMLARWHESMKKLDYDPQYNIPHFHDTPYYAKRLSQLMDSNEFEGQVEDEATKLLAKYKELQPISDTGIQLIHGDPQLSNILFRDFTPLTYIDLDTVMKGSIFLDIGDLLRSTAEADLTDNKPLDIRKLTAIADGYRAKAFPNANKENFRHLAFNATKMIAVELAMRFIIDIADDNYFNWDKTKFPNRRDNHLYRATIQQAIIDQIESIGY